MKNLAACLGLSMALTIGVGLQCQSRAAVSESTPAVIYVQKVPAWAEQPLEVQQMRVGNDEVYDTRPFDAGDFWMKDFTATVRNVSKRTVRGFNLVLQFSPDVKLAQLELFKGLSFGIESAGHEINLAPGESTDVSVADSSFDDLKFHVMHMELPADALRKVTLKVSEVYFDTRHAWFRGSFVIRDVNNTNLFVPDDSQRRKSAKAMHEQIPRDSLVARVSFSPRRTPPCVKYEGSIRPHCTQTGCTDCTIISDTYTDATTTGHPVTTPQIGCTRGDPPTNCGCCKQGIWVNLFEDCIP